MVEVVIKSGEKTLPLTVPNGFLVKAVSGIESADASVKTNSNAQFDGSYIISDAVARRMVSISVVPIDIATATRKRHELISFIVPHQEYEIYIRRDGRIRSIVGRLSGEITTSNAGAWWTKVYRLRFVCPSPFWKDETDKEVVFRQVVPLMAFPFSPMRGAGTVSGLMVTEDRRFIINEGDVPVGVVATIYARGGPVVNPSINLGAQYVKAIINMEVGDVLTISTVPGEKYILHNGEKHMRFDRRSTFFQLPKGVSEISVNAEDGTLDNVSCAVVYRNQYSGV